MRPDDNTPHQPTVRIPKRDDFSLTPYRDGPHTSQNQPKNTGRHQAATANIARSQIEAIYNNDPNSLMAVEAEPDTRTNLPPGEELVSEKLPEQSTSEAPTVPESANQPQITKFAQNNDQSKTVETENPYERSHDNSNLSASKQSWDEYHSAWQNYYQQYFHRYYAGHIQQTSAALAAEQQRAKQLASQPSTMTPEQAMDDIRSKLRGKISQKAKAVRRSRHFIPIAAAMTVMLLFVFLQYNRFIISNIQAYVSPGKIDPSNIIVDPTTELAVGPEPRLIIPKINVEVPVVWDAKPDNNSQMAAMERGVAWFGIPGANSKPGQIGNTVLSGHSSNDWLDNGNYKFIFARLEQMKKDDTIYINYKGTRYTYVVTRTETVKPTDVDALIYDTDKPELTLITCTPLGTALNRFLVTAEQVSPSPNEATAKPKSSSGQTAPMPGNSPTMLERVFGN